jgi:hypothetical protein
VFVSYKFFSGMSLFAENLALNGGTSKKGSGLAGPAFPEKKYFWEQTLQLIS